MKKSLVGMFALIITLGLFTPAAVHAEEATPPDAPYQETTEEPTEATTEPVIIEPVVEETSATLPTVYNSPMTPADPTLQPVVIAQPQTEPAEVAVTPTGSAVSRLRLVSNLLTTLTPQSMRNSRIWSNF